MTASVPVRQNVIDVLIRVRPMRSELQEVRAMWDTSATTLRERGNPDSFFTFDHVYGTEVSTEEIYERSVRHNVVANVVKGYNGTVFAYGQTGSGKTYTMLGGGDHPHGVGGGSSGIVALSVRDLFSDIEREKQRNASWRVSVYVTIIEIYNEQLRDLLLASGAATAPLSIRENEHGVYVHNATKREVKSARECVQLIYKHAAGRVSAFTSMNEISSRSHCVICIHVKKTLVFPENSTDTSSCGEAEDEEEEEEGAGKEREMTRKIIATLSLVDLAGSERVAKAGLTGLRRVEGGHINKSLTTLTTVISRLTEASSGGNGGGSSNNNNHNNNSGTTPAFIPYRDSRLTHLLKTAIGGNSLTAVFCCITPAAQHVNESRSTLQFAARVKAIKNQALVNEFRSPKMKLREMEVKLSQMRRMMVATTIYLWSKNLRIKNLQAKLANTHSLVAPGVRMRPANVGGGAASQAAPKEQQRLLFEQLTRENDALRRELAETRSALQQHAVFSRDTCHDANVAAIGLADDEEKRQLRADVRDLERMLKEVVDEKSAIQKSMDELDGLCKELEDENAALVSTNKELQALVDAKRSAEGAAKHEVDVLKRPLSKSQCDVLDRGRGDEYLHQLTKLHMEHQELQHAHHQLQETHKREMGEARANTERMREKMEELEDEVAELRDANKLQNSYLWRLLGVASVLSRGKAVVPEDTTTAPVRGEQVDAAVKTLTSFVTMSLERPSAVLRSAEGDHKTTSKKWDNGQQEEQEDGTGADTTHSSNGKDSVSLLKRIEELQQQLVAKDTHRDVIVDNKLKRMQNLALRLHTTNTALVQELRQCCALCDELFCFLEEQPKLTVKLAKAGIVPISFKAAIERATTAKVPLRPYGHN